ncbi:MAG TPA: hypothetical protein DCQ98_19015 [Planctomycetaceae bacterium]|nr:hypothetical protein [Planctomycetaceae bacterium]HRF00472.1 UbiA family prenyltransferase [Pirellulaceae bacterium]
MLAYLRLMRISNVFTVVADVTAAFLVAHGSLSPWTGYLGLLVAAMLMYCAGMVLNDRFDLEQDRVERPERPIPSGKVSPSAASRLGWGLLIAGVLIAAATGWFVGSPEGAARWRIGVMALALAGMILAYDAVLKRSIFGPLAMGSCRTLEILMAAGLSEGDAPVPCIPAVLLLASGIGIYIAGVTWFARTEAVRSARSGLIGGVTVMGLGFVILGLIPFVDPTWREALGARSPWFWPGLLALIASTVLRRGATAIADPSPRTVQIAVKQAILTLIVIDASVCLFARPNEIYWSLFVLTLLAPTLWLGRWIRST